ncbi:hypothetical protein BHE74_00050497, partial [Ensete ventricosum]
FALRLVAVNLPIATAITDHGAIAPLATLPSELFARSPFVMTVAVGPPVSAAAVRPTWAAMQGRKDKGSGGMGNVLRVLRNDRGFLTERLRPLSNALGNLLWLRNLENPRAQDVRRPPAAWPKISHPPDHYRRGGGGEEEEEEELVEKEDEETKRRRRSTGIRHVDAAIE